MLDFFMESSIGFGLPERGRLILIIHIFYRKINSIRGAAPRRRGKK